VQCVAMLVALLLLLLLSLIRQRLDEVQIAVEAAITITSCHEFWTAGKCGLDLPAGVLFTGSINIQDPVS
jgi:uncharacterized membrane protein